MARLEHGCRGNLRKLRPWIRKMPPPAVHASPSAAVPRRRLVRGFVIGMVAALLMAYVGALGTGPAPFGQRLLYWMAVILPGSLFGLMFTALVRGWGGLADRRWAEIMAVAFAISIPHTFLVVVASALFFGVDAITPGLVIRFWTSVMLLGLALTAINFLASPNQALPMAPPADSLPADPTAKGTGSESTDGSGLPLVPAVVADKLPPGLRAGRLLAIQAEDHYLRIYTDLGDDLVLMRMGDACTLLPDAAGARIHRSWWVARAAVAGRTVEGSRMTLKLHNGTAVPVSRTMRPFVRDNGWG